MAEGSKPPSVQSGIQLSVRTSVRATLWSELAPVRVRRSIRSPRSETATPSRSRAQPARNNVPTVSARFPLRVSSPSLALGVRTPHRSRGGVSFLFQSRRSPAPGLRPVTCPDGGGTFLVGELTTGAGLPLPHSSTHRSNLSRSVTGRTTRSRRVETPDRAGQDSNPVCRGVFNPEADRTEFSLRGV